VSGNPRDIPPDEEQRARREAGAAAMRQRLAAMAWDATELPPVDELTLRSWRERVDWDAAMAIVRRRYVADS
jgi:hypothetical protein